MSNAAPRRLLKTAVGFTVFPLVLFASPLAGVLDEVHPSVRAVMAVQREVTGHWMRQPEVLGTAVTVNSIGGTALTVYIDRDSAKAADAVRSLPQQYRGVGVQIHLTDKFRAMRRTRRRRKVISVVSHTVMQAPPIQLGTSGGWSKDLANGFCCGGTLGSLVQIGGEQYILSNYHVLESDIVSGGNNAVATAGDEIIQPALIDTRCSADDAQSVATLETRSALPNNNVDCAIAKLTPGMVRADGAILEIGTISSQTVAASIGQAVKKSGRTTGLTHSFVAGLNATISVTYDDECAGSTAFTKIFTGQIVVSNGGSGGFLAAGDSGSLLVEDVTVNPRAIGLLFAGSSTDAIANPIDDVLTFLGATMVGN